MRVAKLWSLALSGLMTLALALPALAADEAKPERKPGDRPAGERPSKEEIMKRFDKDGDGKLNDEEKQTAQKAREEGMKRRGGDGAPGGAGGPGGVGGKMHEEMMKKFDKDGNGTLDESEKKVAREELMKHRGTGTGGPGGPSGKMREEMMKKFDKDGNGQLDESEQQEAKKAREAMMKRHTEGGGPGGERKPGDRKPGDRPARPDKKPADNK